MEKKVVSAWKFVLRYQGHFFVFQMLFFVAMVAIFVLNIQLVYVSQEELDRKQVENVSYTQQLQTLNNLEGSLNNLIQFVNVQKVKLKETEDVVSRLKNEQEKLKPAVEADRKTVEAILSLNHERERHDVWRERGMGFLLGVVASMIASIFISVGQYMARRKRIVPQAPTSD